MNLVDTLGEGSVSIEDLVINLLLGAVLSIILAVYYIRFGRTYSDRSNHARIIPILAVTTLLVITIVKSSLALSLGLVGALSIVRFRTPIKEPEELAYLFLAIAIGLGLGANQRAATLIGLFVILAVLLIPNLWTKRAVRQNTYMRIVMPDIDQASGAFESVVTSLAEHAHSADLRRIDVSGSVMEATMYVSTRDPSEITSIMDELRGQFPGVEISFVQQETGFDV